MLCHRYRLKVDNNRRLQQTRVRDSIEQCERGRLRRLEVRRGGVRVPHQRLHDRKQSQSPLPGRRRQEQD